MLWTGDGETVKAIDIIMTVSRGIQTAVAVRLGISFEARVTTDARQRSLAEV